MEDFVPFELAVKLREKGFNEQCLAYYTKDSVFYYNATYGPDVESSFRSFNSHPNSICGKRIDVPIISQVLKWLREEKDIFIEIEYINQEDCGCTIILQETGDLIAEWNWDKFKYANKNPLVRNTYEQTALAGIEYVIDNLL